MADMVNEPQESERWKTIAGWGDLYEVSSLGRVRSSRTGKVRVPGSWDDRYLVLNLYRDGQSKVFAVHRLVAEAFVEKPRPAFNTVNHKNGLKHDNRAENLEWCSPTENNMHAWSSGLNRRTPKLSSSVKSMSQRCRQAVVRLAAAGVDIAVIAEAFQLTEDAARAIARHG